MIKAKKKFGQNFLKDINILNEIIKTIPNDQNKIVEIGAGLGDLTVHLLQIGDVVAFEIDEELCSFLSNRFKNEILNNKLKLICGNVLDIWKKDQPLLENNYKLIANLPYYIATKIIMNGLEDKFCKNMVLMIQKEVGNKFLAKSGLSDFSSLSIIAQSVCDIDFVVDVPPTSFEPQPKVNSVVISFDKLNLTDEQNIDQNFKEMLNFAFLQPRQTLYKNLSKVLSQNLVTEIFDTLQFNRSIRPHQLDIKDYHQIYKILKRHKS